MTSRRSSQDLVHGVLMGNPLRNSRSKRSFGTVIDYNSPPITQTVQKGNELKEEEENEDLKSSLANVENKMKDGQGKKAPTCKSKPSSDALLKHSPSSSPSKHRQSKRKDVDDRGEQSSTSHQDRQSSKKKVVLDKAEPLKKSKNDEDLEDWQCQDPVAMMTSAKPNCAYYRSLIQSRMQALRETLEENEKLLREIAALHSQNDDLESQCEEIIEMKNLLDQL